MVFFICFVELNTGVTEMGLKKAREVLKTVQGWSDKALPNKTEVLGNLYSYIGIICILIHIHD